MGSASLGSDSEVMGRDRWAHEDKAMKDHVKQVFDLHFPRGRRNSETGTAVQGHRLGS